VVKSKTRVKSNLIRKN